MSSATDHFPTPNGPTEPSSALTRETLADRLTSELRQQIVSGRLAPGDLMPTERELGEAFGVGRTTVREALHGLIAIGFVERRSGSLFVRDRGDLVADSNVAAMAARISVRDVFETRKAIEGKAVELAAQQRDGADLRRIRGALDRMREATGSEFHQADIEFHFAVVDASKNVVLRQVYEDSKAMFFELPAFWRLSGGQQVQPRSTAGWEGHSSVADAIERGDAETAVRITCDLLDWASANLAERIAGSRAATDAN